MCTTAAVATDTTSCSLLSQCGEKTKACFRLRRRSVRSVWTCSGLSQWMYNPGRKAQMWECEDAGLHESKGCWEKLHLNLKSLTAATKLLRFLCKACYNSNTQQESLNSHKAKNRETMSWDSMEKENAAERKQNSRNDATLTSCVPKETMSLKMKANTQSMKC